MDPAEDLVRNLNQLRNGLTGDQETTPWGQLLIHIGPHLGFLVERLKAFFDGCNKFDALDVLAGQVSDQLNRNQEKLLRALRTQKNNCSFYENWWGEPIDSVIAKVEQFSNEAINEAFNTITQRINEAKVAQAKAVLQNSTYAMGISAIFTTLQVISIYLELKQVSELTESSRKKLASDGDIGKFMTQVEEYLAEAAEFLDQNQLDLASDSLNAAGEKAQYMYDALNGLQDKCGNKINTLKKNQYLAAGTGISTLTYGLLQIATIVNTPTAGIGLGLQLSSWAIVGWNFLLASFSAGALINSGKRMKKLQKILDEVEEKLKCWSQLNERIDKMRNLVKSKRMRGC